MSDFSDHCDSAGVGTTKQFMCTVRGEPCECDKQGCTAKQKDPNLVALERIADSLEDLPRVLNILDNIEVNLRMGRRG